MLQILGQGFLSMKLTQKINFRVQGFFNNCIEKNQKKTHFEEGTSESPPSPFGAFLKIHEFWRSPPFLTEPYPTLEVIKSCVR